MWWDMTCFGATSVHMYCSRKEKTGSVKEKRRDGRERKTEERNVPVPLSTGTKRFERQIMTVADTRM